MLHELEYFRSYDLYNEPDLAIAITKSLEKYPSLKRKIVTEQKDNIFKVKYSEHLGKLGAQFALTFFPNKTEIQVNSLIAKSKHVLYVNLVEPILRFIFLSKGYLLLHSACVVDKNGTGILLSAPPDTGKTTTVLKCLKAGFSFLSDDMTILRPPDKALCFPKPMTISSHTYSTATSVSANNLPSDKKDKKWMKLRSVVHSKEGRQFVRKIAKYNIPIFTINTVGQIVVRPPKFNLTSLLEGAHIQNDASIQTLYFIEKGDELTTPLSMPEALQKAVDNSDDAFIFPPYKDLVKYFTIGGKTSTELLEIEKERLVEIFGNIDIKVMKSENRVWAEKLMQVVNVT